MMKRKVSKLKYFFYPIRFFHLFTFMSSSKELSQLKQFLLSFDPNTTTELDFSKFFDEVNEEEVLDEFIEKLEKTKTLKTYILDESSSFSQLKNDEKMIKKMSQAILKNSSITHLSLRSKKKKFFLHIFIKTGNLKVHKNFFKIVFNDLKNQNSIEFLNLSSKININKKILTQFLSNEFSTEMMEQLCDLLESNLKINQLELFCKPFH